MLTNKKRSYSEARVAGKNQTQAAIAAGYAAKSASSAGSRLEKDPDVKRHITRLKNAAKKNASKKQETKSDKKTGGNQKSKTRITDPREILINVMNDESEDTKLRIDAAVKLDQIDNKGGGAKPKLGKKEQQQEAAEEVEEKSKFSTGRPPLHAVN